MPKRSATADRKEIPNASRRKTELNFANAIDRGLIVAPRSRFDSSPGPALPSLLSNVRGDRAILMVRGWRSPSGSSRCGARRSDKASDQCGDFIRRRVQCEMTGVENVNLSVPHIVAIGLRLREIEREVILPPDHQQARLLLAHPGLPLGVILHVRAVVVEEVALNVGLAGLVGKIKFI